MKTINADENPNLGYFRSGTMVQEVLQLFQRPTSVGPAHQEGFWDGKGNFLDGRCCRCRGPFCSRQGRSSSTGDGSGDLLKTLEGKGGDLERGNMQVIWSQPFTFTPRTLQWGQIFDFASRYRDDAASSPIIALARLAATSAQETSGCQTTSQVMQVRPWHSRQTM